MEDIRLLSIDLGSDGRQLYRFMISEDQYLFSSNLVFNTENSFLSWLNNRLIGEFHDFYKVCCGDICIGFVYSYDFSLVDGHCKAVAYVDEAYQNTGYGCIAGAMFIKKLFDSYPLRKVYTTVYDYNRQSLDSNLRAGFTEEGCIRGFRYYNGEYCDLHILSVEREAFYQNIGRLII